MLSLVVNQRTVDLPQDVDIAINYQLNILNRITDRSDDFSYSFKLPNTTDNQNFFNSIFIINTEEFLSITPYDSTAPETWNQNIAFTELIADEDGVLRSTLTTLSNYNHLNPNQCRLIENDLVILEGFFRLKEIITTNGFVEYLCEIYGKSNPIIDQFRRRKLQDIGITENSSYNTATGLWDNREWDEIICFTKNYIQGTLIGADIVNGFSLDDKVCYPLINYGTLNTDLDQNTFLLKEQADDIAADVDAANAAGVDTPNIKFPWNTTPEATWETYKKQNRINTWRLRPAYFIKSIFYRLFADLGYGIVSEFWNDPEISRLVIAFTKDKFKLKTGYISDVLETVYIRSDQDIPAPPPGQPWNQNVPLFPGTTIPWQAPFVTYSNQDGVDVIQNITFDPLNTHPSPTNPGYSCTSKPPGATVFQCAVGFSLENLKLKITCTNQTGGDITSQIQILIRRSGALNTALTPYDVEVDFIEETFPSGVNTVIYTVPNVGPDLLYCEGVRADDQFSILIKSLVTDPLIVYDVNVLQTGIFKMVYPDNIVNYRFRLAENLPDINQWDLIKSLITMFNLYIKLDPVNKIAYVETRNNFFKTYQLAIEYFDTKYQNSDVNITGEKQDLFYDLSNLVNRSVPIKQRFTIDEFNSLLNFLYNQDSNDYYLKNRIENPLLPPYISDIYADQRGVKYGDYQLISKNKNLTGKYDIKPNLFSPFLTDYLKYGFGKTKICHLVKEELNIDNQYGTEYSNNFGLKIGYYHRVNFESFKQQNDVTLYDVNWILAVTKAFNLLPTFAYTVYPTIIFSREDFDLLGPDFNPPSTQVEGLEYSLEWKYLYNKYYYDEIQLYFNSRLVTFEVFLDSWFLQNLDLSKPVRIDDTFYYFYKISQYKPNNRESTKVELIKIK